LIRFFRVSKTYSGGQVALSDITLRVSPGEFVLLTGASGAGKSTFLRLIYREELPTTGQILVNGRSVATLPRSKVPYLRRTIGIVFQDFRLIERRTIFENVSYLPRILGLDLKQRRQMASTTLSRVGLAHRMAAFPAELSAGERQRVAIARALINRPDILIADEPTGNLDPDLAREIFALFHEINHAGTTVLVATHDHRIVREYGRRVLTLRRGQLVSDRRDGAVYSEPVEPAPSEALEP
jgi:cell division transport system ATP-binding protein